MTRKDLSRWLKAIAKLRRIAPTVLPIRVRTIEFPAKEKEMLGTCQLNHDHILIRINKKASLDHRIETLIHEWVHGELIVLDEVRKTDNYHGPVFDAAHGELSRRYVDA